MNSYLKVLMFALAVFLIGGTTFVGAQKSSQKTTQSPVAASSTESQDPKQQEPEPEVVRVETNLVNTLFTAVDADRHFITSLRPEDVRILENDVPQPISLFERETNRPLSLALLIDTSESQRAVLPGEKNAAQTFIDLVIRPEADRAAVVSFTGVPKLEQPLTNDLRRIRNAINQVRIELSAENARRLALGEDPLPKDQDPSGYTSLWDSLWMTVNEVLSKGPENARRAVILLSDGDDTSSTIKRQDVIDLAVKTDAVIYSIGIRDWNFPEGKLDSGALKKVSDRTGGRAFFPRSTDELRSVFAQIENELRSQYLVAYSPTNKLRDGTYRRIKLEVINPELRKNKVQLLYRQGYYARKF